MTKETVNNWLFDVDKETKKKKRRMLLSYLAAVHFTTISQLAKT